MAVRLDIIGRKTPPTPFTYNHDTVILYALGIGAGVTELDFVYEKHLKIFPTFAVIPFMPSFFDEFVPFANINAAALLHGEHQIVVHQPIPVRATVYNSVVCDAIYDKGDKGAMLHVTVETRDEHGVLLFENRAVVVDRSAGHFGGDRGPRTALSVTPEDGEPIFKMAYVVSPSQAALYRLSGDKNPLHIDSAAAHQAGFRRPILHGLCSFGYAGRAILHTLCHSEPAYLKSLAVRFMNVVYPGDTLITEAWATDRDGIFSIRTLNQEGLPVLSHGLAEIVTPSGC